MLPEMLVQVAPPSVDLKTWPMPAPGPSVKPAVEAVHRECQGRLSSTNRPRRRRSGSGRPLHCCLVPRSSRVVRPGPHAIVRCGRRPRSVCHRRPAWLLHHAATRPLAVVGPSRWPPGRRGTEGGRPSCHSAPERIAKPLSLNQMELPPASMLLTFCFVADERRDEARVLRPVARRRTSSPCFLSRQRVPGAPGGWAQVCVSSSDRYHVLLGGCCSRHSGRRGRHRRRRRSSSSSSPLAEPVSVDRAAVVLEAAADDDAAGTGRGLRIVGVRACRHPLRSTAARRWCRRSVSDPVGRVAVLCCGGAGQRPAVEAAVIALEVRVPAVPLLCPEGNRVLVGLGRPAGSGSAVRVGRVDRVDIPAREVEVPVRTDRLPVRCRRCWSRRSPRGRL